MQKTILITGCSGQLGYSLCRNLSSHFNVIPTYRTHKNKKQVIKDQLQKINWKKLDNLHKQILQVGRTKKISFPKSKKTKRKRRK